MKTLRAPAPLFLRTLPLQDLQLAAIPPPIAAFAHYLHDQSSETPRASTAARFFVFPDS